MVNYQAAKVKLIISQINKLKSAANNQTEKTLTIARKNV